MSRKTNPQSPTCAEREHVLKENTEHVLKETDGLDIL